MNSSPAVALLNRVLHHICDCLTPEAAHRLVSLRADSLAQIRLDELADKNTEGQLSLEERGEYEAYIAVANVIGILQTKARSILSDR